MSYNIPTSEEPNLDELMNKGWSSMSEILDKEMPQAQKRRLLLPWFLAFGVILLCGSFYLWVHQVPSPNVPIIENKAKPDKDSKHMEIAALSNPLPRVESIGASSVNRKTVQGPTALSDKRSSTARVFRKPDIDNLAGSAIAQQASIPPAIRVNNSVNQDPAATSKGSDASELSSIDDQKASRALVDNLEAISPLVPEALAQEEAKIVPSQKYLPKTINPHQFLLETGLTQAILSNKSGVQVGVSYGYSLKKQLRLSIGLAYCYQFTPIQAISDYNYDEAEPILNKSTSSELLRSNFNTKYHQIRIPVSFLYQFGSRWGATAGVSMIYDRPIITVQKNSARVGTSTPTFTDYNDITYPMVNSFSFAVDLGVQYRLSKHFALKTGIMYNALPFSNKELYLSQKSRHLEANLSCQYRF